MNYSVIVPVYNGEDTLRPLTKELVAFFEINNYTFEIIYVYDCGPDDSWSVLRQLKEEYGQIVKLVKLSRNYGQHNALICGFEYAEGDFFITIDEDLQHNPKDIAKLIAKQKERDCDIVYGKYEELKHNQFRNLTSTIFRKVVQKGVPELCEDYSAFRLIKKHVAQQTISMRNSYTFVDGYLSWVTQSYGSCIVSHNERVGGTSSYSTSKLIEHSINIFVTFSNYPIRLLTKISAILFILSSFYAIYVIISKILFDNFAAGYATFVIVLGMGISLILLAIGILGEYVYRINLKTTKRPNYIVTEEKI